MPYRLTFLGMAGNMNTQITSSVTNRNVIQGTTMLSAHSLRTWGGMLVVLSLGALVSLYFRFDLSYNSFHLDESGYLFVGGWLNEGQGWPTKSYVFSADFPLILLAYFENLLPWQGGRIFSAMVSFASLAFIFIALRRLGFNDSLAGIATAVVAIQPSHITIARLATYDALCFSLVALTFLLLVEAVQRKSMLIAAIGGLVMACAVLAKYIVVVYAPLFCCVLLIKPEHRKLGVAYALAGGSVVGYYIFTFWQDLVVLYFGQIAGSHAANTTYADLLQITFNYLWPLLLGIVILFKKYHSWYNKIVLGVLLFLAIPLVVYHLMNRDVISYYKHLVYPATFLTLLLFYQWQKMHDKSTSKTYSVIGIAFAVCLTLNTSLWAKDFENGWPDTTQIKNLLQVKQDEKILSEDSYLFRNLYYKSHDLGNFSDTNYFDPDGDGQHSDDDIVAAVENKEFAYVYLDRMIRPDVAQRLIDGPLNEHYEQVYYQPYNDLSTTITLAQKPMASLYVLRDKLELWNARNRIIPCEP